MKLATAIAERIRTLREQAQMSQQELAIQADLSLSLIAKIEQGKKADPRASTLLALAGAFGIPPGQILDSLPPDLDFDRHGKKSKKKRKSKPD
ncbi:MAG: helix-turn-helix domain-containing protein [Gemmataceae bacterium]